MNKLLIYKTLTRWVFIVVAVMYVCPRQYTWDERVMSFVVVMLAAYGVKKLLDETMPT